MEVEAAMQARRRNIIRRVLWIVTPFAILYTYFACFLGPIPWIGFTTTSRNRGEISYAQVGTTYVGMWQGLLPIWKHRFGNGFWIEPTVLDSGELVVGNAENLDPGPPMGGEFNGELVVINQHGKVVWEFSPTLGMLESKPSRQQAVLIESWNEGVIGITASGEFAWYKPDVNLQPLAYSFRQPKQGRFFVGTEDFPAQKVVVVCLAANGTEFWRRRVTGEFVNALEVSDRGDVLFTTSLDNKKCGLPYAGYLYCLDNTGKLLWTFAGNPYFAGPDDLKVSGDHVEYVLADGKWGTRTILNMDGKIVSATKLSSRRQWAE
jgi:outer membrane protein assembly factor BamB